jgi:hypothetical protein
METSEFITIISAAAGSLAASIVVLFRTVMQLSKKQTEMSKELGLLQGKQDGIRQLSYDVLDTVHRAIIKRDTKEDK